MKEVHFKIKNEFIQFYLYTKSILNSKVTKIKFIIIYLIHFKK